jgi:O-antigen/teichoic acid export membrane protein
MVICVLYRFLLHTIGVEQLGIWSIVLATTAVTRVADVGLSASVVKFVAKYVARKEDDKTSDVIQTAAITVALFVGIVLLAFYFVAVAILEFVVPMTSLPLTLSLLPYAFSSFWISSVTAVFNSGLDGYQRIDIKSVILMAAMVLNLLVCFWLVPVCGLAGVAYSQVMQALFVFCCSWLLLRRYLKNLPILPHRWNLNLFREMLSYGVNFQIFALVGLFCDPVTKGLLARFGDLQMVGYYEMANRVILQFRTLLLSANQVLVPVVADLYEQNRRKIQTVYRTSYHALFYIAVPCFSLIIAVTPSISELLIGHYESVFVFFTILLASGSLLNTLSAPAHFTNLGTGQLCWSTIGFVAMGITNICLGALFGLLLGGIGVVIAWVFAMVLGGSIIGVSYHLRYKIPLTELFSHENTLLMGSSVAGIFAALGIRYWLREQIGLLGTSALSMLVFSAITGVAVWVNPMRRQLTGWVRSDLLSPHFRLSKPSLCGEKS